MSAPDDLDRAFAFVGDALAREGADVEPSGAGALFALLPEPLATALSLPAAVTLRVAGEVRPDESACPVEGATVQWLADRARGRGRLAGARLEARTPSAARCAEEARRRLHLLNATLVDATARPAVATTIVAEFAFEARSSERTDGVVAVAVPDGHAAPSLALAAAILRALPEARPEAPDVASAWLSGAIGRARPLVEAEVRRRIAPFLDDCARRMALEQERVRAYHDRLAREAGRRRGRPAAGMEPTVEAKREAILRAREERLADVAERHAVDAVLAVDGVLVARYAAVEVTAHVRRRRREVSITVRRDPFSEELVGPACGACGKATLAIHVCDEAGHVTCAACARPCPACGRTACRACAPGACGCA